MFIKISGVYINVDNIVDFYDLPIEGTENTYCHIVLKGTELDTNLKAEEVMLKILEARKQK